MLSSTTYPCPSAGNAISSLLTTTACRSFLPQLHCYPLLPTLTLPQEMLFLPCLLPLPAITSYCNQIVILYSLPVLSRRICYFFSAYYPSQPFHIAHCYPLLHTYRPQGGVPGSAAQGGGVPLLVLLCLLPLLYCYPLLPTPCRKAFLGPLYKENCVPLLVLLCLLHPAILLSSTAYPLQEVGCPRISLRSETEAK